MPGFIKPTALHTLQGLGLKSPPASSWPIMNSRLIATGGGLDDGFGIGGNHFTPTMRRNVDLTVYS